MVNAWAPGRSDNYRAEFVALDPDEALQRIITGMGELSRGELAGERMTVAFEERSQEDEHSCFADNTIADIVANALGIQMVYMGDYGTVSGTGIKDLIAAHDQTLAQQRLERPDSGQREPGSLYSGAVRSAPAGGCVRPVCWPAGHPDDDFFAGIANRHHRGCRPAHRHHHQRQLARPGV